MRYACLLEISATSVLNLYHRLENSVVLQLRFLELSFIQMKINRTEEIKVKSAKKQ